jgi:hypothetical protein
MNTVEASDKRNTPNVYSQWASKLSQRAKCIGWVVLAILAFIGFIFYSVLMANIGGMIGTLIAPLSLGIPYIVLIMVAIGVIILFSLAVGYFVSNSQGILKVVRPDIISAIEKWLG